MNLTKQLILASASLMLMPTITKADGDNAINSIIVWTADGEHVSYLLEERPKILMTSTELVLKTISAEVFYPLSDYVKLTFGTESTNDTKITNLLTESKIIVKLTSETVCVSNLAPSESLSIHAIDGKLMTRISADTEGKASFSIANYATGVYIIKTHNQSFKFMKK